jgi:hypothetical protein
MPCTVAADISNPAANRLPGALLAAFMKVGMADVRLPWSMKIALTFGWADMNPVKIGTPADAFALVASSISR